MIIIPSLSCIHWLEVVYRINAVMTSFSFYNVMRQHLDYVHDVIFKHGIDPVSWFKNTGIFSQYQSRWGRVAVDV